LKHDIFFGAKGEPFMPWLGDISIASYSFPIKQMTMFDWIIMITQLYAFVFNFHSAARDIVGGVKDFMNISSWKSELKRKFQDTHNPSPEQKILENGLAASGWKAIRMIFSGLCEIVLGTTFLICAINSTGYYRQSENPRNLDPVVDSLIAMEVAMVYFIFLMVADLLRGYRNYHSLCAIANEEALYNEPEKYGVSSSLFKVLNFKPSWEEGQPSSLLNNDVVQLRSILSGAYIF
jgi:hypothetical protein